MKAYACAVSTVVLLASASCRKKQEGLSLRENVAFYCGNLARDLDRASNEYGELAPFLDGNQLKPDQRQRALRSLNSSAIGGTVDARMEKMQAIHSQMLFCLYVRDLDEQRIAALEARFTRLIQTLREHDLDGVFHEASAAKSPEAAVMIDAIRSQMITKHVEAANLLGELAKVAHEIDTAPLKD